MNVEPIPTVSDRINEIRQLTARIVNDEILPNENMLWGWQSGQRFTEADREESRHVARAHQGAGETGGVVGTAPPR